MAQELESRLQKAVLPGPYRELAGAVVAATNQDASKTYCKAFGTKTIEDTQPLPEDQFMWVASCAKLPTAMLVLHGWEAGLYDLDDPDDVKRLLPEWANRSVLKMVTKDNGCSEFHEAAAQRPFTLRELLTHSSGSAYDFAPPLLNWRQSRGEGVKSFTKSYHEALSAPHIFQPGADFRYGHGYDLAGLMLERASGLTLDAYAQKHLLLPLGMRSSTYDPDGLPKLRESLLLPVQRATDGGLEAGVPDWAKQGSGKDHFGGGSFFTTAGDFMKLLFYLLRNDGKILRRDTVEMMMQPGNTSAGCRAGVNRDFNLGYAIPMLAPGMEGDLEWDQGLGGVVLDSDSPLKLNKGAFMWHGMPNTLWTIDRKANYAYVMFTQLHPSGDVKTDPLRADVRKALAKEFATTLPGRTGPGVQD